MKRFRNTLLLLLATMLTTTAMADEPLTKAMQKECKRALKNMKKEGWQVMGGLAKLDDVVVSYYAAIEKEGVTQIVGTATATDANRANTIARTNAVSEYAAQMNTLIEREADTKVQNVNGQTRSEFVAQMKSKVKERVRRLSPKMSLMRQNEEGKVEVQLFYIVPSGIE